MEYLYHGDYAVFPVCERCGHRRAGDDVEPTEDSHYHCPSCSACGHCGCCPCGRDECSWCAPDADHQALLKAEYELAVRQGLVIAPDLEGSP